MINDRGDERAGSGICEKDENEPLEDERAGSGEGRNGPEGERGVDKS